MFFCEAHLSCAAGHMTETMLVHGDNTRPGFAAAQKAILDRIDKRYGMCWVHSVRVVWVAPQE